MALIRGEVSYRPIQGEKVTTDLNIWRFNFGWIKKTRNVTTDESGADGTVTEVSTVGVSGDPNLYSETTAIKGLSASLICPGNLEASGSCILDSYSKKGVVYRVSPLINLFGLAPSMYSLGSVSYGVIEQKGYADAISRSQPGDSTPPGLVVDMVSVSANGVNTVTIATG